jgi:hypothetical protein
MPMWAGFPTYNDADCTDPRLWDVAGQLVQPVVQGSFTNELEDGLGAVQLRWVAKASEVFGVGDDTCDLEQGHNVYAMKRLTPSGPAPEELRIYGTGATGVATLICTDDFRDAFTFSWQTDLPSHEDFLEDSEPWEMFRVMLQFIF